MTPIRRALLSVTDKSGLVNFSRQLAALGVELISTGGTARLLRDAGLPVRDVAEVTGFPEMLGGRVKTMHPRITGGILAIRSKPEHMQALADHGIAPIDLVVVNLYAFEATAARPGVTLQEMIDNIDIGGPTMIRSAAKNFEDVAVVTDPADYPDVAQELQASGGVLSRDTRWRLARKAFATTAAYDRAIANTLSGGPSEALPAILDLRVPRTMGLRYGENPHQSASLYARGKAGIAGARQLHGKELSYNNLVDLDAAWQLIREFQRTAAAIIKHTNPCGCAEQDTLAQAYRRALECDPVSAFGGVLAFNRPLDGETAAAVAELFAEAIAAPGYSPEALARLQTKKNLRLIEVVDESPGVVVRSISGGYLVQTEDSLTLDPGRLKTVTDRSPTPDETIALEFAWKVVKHVKSNAIVFARAGQTIGIGAGQMSRVDSVRIAASKAVLPLHGTVVASDAFFPFPDGVEELARHGATAVIQPGGSVRDPDVIAAANRLGVAMVFTGIRHFRH
jgi:phosphoribosylaminoimidazolecarboxamide formyltransferase/IMP cyclohydrolase